MIRVISSSIYCWVDSEYSRSPEGSFPRKERRAPPGGKDDVLELFAHAVVADHLPGDLGRPGDVIGGARRDLPEEQLFARAAPEQHVDLAEQLLLRQKEAVFGGSRMV